MRPVSDTVFTDHFSPAVAAFLDRPIHAQLATVNPNGTPQLTVMWFLHEGGALLFTTVRSRAKYRNQARSPHGAAIVVDPDDPYRWVSVSGALSVDDRDPVAFYRLLAERYLRGEELETWRRGALLEGRTVLKLTPGRVRTLGFPAA